MSDDRDLVASLNRLNEQQMGFARAMEEGNEPPVEEQEEFERLAGSVQVSPVYQGYASAQANFDRLMVRIQEEIAKGVEAGEQSRIILPS
jgi:tRNA(Ser,Leu) C12 N-acetylase TAN1